MGTSYTRKFSKMFYLDANFFVFALFDNTKKGENARILQKGIIEGKHSAATSVLTIDELMWVIVKLQRKNILRQVVEDIYAMPNLEVRGVPSLTPVSALDFMEKYNLKPRDAFHTAIMKQFQLTDIVSDDADFDRVKGIKRIKL